MSLLSFTSVCFLLTWRRITHTKGPENAAGCIWRLFVFTSLYGPSSPSLQPFGCKNRTTRDRTRCDNVRLTLIHPVTALSTCTFVLSVGNKRSNEKLLSLEIAISLLNILKMKKALRGDANTARWAVVRPSQRFSPRRRPPSRGRGTAKINSAGDGHYLYLQTQFGDDRCAQFRVIVVTDAPHTHPQTDRTDNNTLRRS